MMVGNLLALFGVFSESSDSMVEVIFVIAIPINEIVLALWLILKGFDRSPPRTGLDPAADRITLSA